MNQTKSVAWRESENDPEDVRNYYDDELDQLTFPNAINLIFLPCRPAPAPATYSSQTWKNQIYKECSQKERFLIPSS